MLNLTFAPSADVLVPLAKVRIFGAWRDPFDPPAVIVPNPAVGKWLGVRLAQDPSIGCVANARMLTLERFLWDALEPEPDTALIDAGHLSQVICALLDEDLLAGDVYKPLRGYLLNNSRVDAVKRVQLSARIARQFLEYEYNRPSVWSDEASRWGRHGIDAKWLSGKPYFDGDGREHEGWQMDLYRRAYDCLLKNEPPRRTTLPHLYRRRREERARVGRPWCNAGPNPQIILFGVSKISHFHRNTLVEISQSAGVDMHVFLTNPCAEFWEDVDTSRRTRAPRRRWSSDSPDEAAGIKPVKPDDYDKPELDMFDDEEDHALLKLWGAAGKENIFLWCPQAQWNFEYHGGGADTDIDTQTTAGRLPQPPANTTLLHAIQKSLLSRNNSLEFNGTAKNKDRSLQILACPDLSREVEEVRELILDMARENVISDFSDVAVYMPSPGKHAPYIQRVFGAYPRGHSLYIPFNILGASGGASLAARAFNALLGIAGGGFNRALVFELLDNPVVSASRGFSRGDLERWEEWADEYGMFRGYNARQRELMGDRGCAVTDEHTFERGMRRVLEESAEAGDAGAARSAEIFMTLLGELSELSAFFSGGTERADAVRPRNENLLDVRESVEVVRRAIWLWLGRIGGGSVDEAAETRVRREALSGLEQIELQYKCAGRAGISREEFLALARGCAAGELSAPSTAWRGVTFAPLRASMVLPHRAVFAIGLCAAEFPGTNDSPGWDLLSNKRIVGDSDKVRDNRFAFLELLHAAKERLVLSYRARDMQKDEALQPSSVILELEDYLTGQGLVDTRGNSRVCSVRREIPWVAHEALSAAREAGRGHGSWDKEQRALAAESLKERAAHRSELAVNRGYPSVNNAVSAEQPYDGATNALPREPIETGEALEIGSATLRRVQQAAGQARNGEHERSSAKNVDIWDVKQFLSNPLEYHLCRTLGIRNDDDTGDMAATDEPLDSGYKRAALRKKAWTEILGIVLTNNINTANIVDNSSIIDTAGKIYDAHINSGQAPEGHICRMEREELAKWAANCADAATALLADFPNHRLVEKYEFALPCGEFTINARYPLTLIPKDTDNQHLATGVIAFDKAGKPVDNLKLWLDGLVMSLNEARNGGARRPVALVSLNHGDEPEAKTSFMSVDENGLRDAETWLAGILKQMLIDKRREHLPFSVIADILKPAKKKKTAKKSPDDSAEESYDERLRKLTARSLRDYLAKKGYATFTDAFWLTDAKPPEIDDDELRRIADSRYAPVLDGKRLMKGKAVL
jgi:exodeoxyribonuclease V gamma subunit